MLPLYNPLVSSNVFRPTVTVIPNIPLINQSFTQQTMMAMNNNHTHPNIIENDEINEGIDNQIDYENGNDNINDNNDENDNSKNKKNDLNVEHDSFFNMQQLLAENILTSDYFKSLYRYKTYHEVINEIFTHCRNLEPRMVGLSRKPSTAFCILYKFFTMGLTVKQVKGLLSNEDSPYIRAIGFLYLRYLVPAKYLWKWFEPYFDDTQELSPGADGKIVTLGKYIQTLLVDQRYYGTILPRIPVPILRAFKKKLLEREFINEKDKKNEIMREDLQWGTEIEAEWVNDHNWYRAKIDKCLENGKFLVTFHDYDDQVEVSIGQIRPLPKNAQNKYLNDSRETVSSNKHSKSRSLSSSISRSHARQKKYNAASRHYKKHSPSRSKSNLNSRSRSRSHGGTHTHTRSRSRSQSHSHSRNHNRKSARSRSRTRSRSQNNKKDRTDNEHSYHRSSHRDNNHNKESHSSNENDVDLEALVLKKERENAAAVGRDYARRPISYKTSLTLPHQTGTNRKRSLTPIRPSRRREHSSEKKEVKVPKKQQSAEHLEKMRQLKLIYGDASANGSSNTTTN